MEAEPYFSESGLNVQRRVVSIASRDGVELHLSILTLQRSVYFLLNNSL